jgi:hypothetical protein
MTAIAFYAAGLFDVPTGFKRIQGPGTDLGFDKQRAVGLDENGDEGAADVHSGEHRFDEIFESISDTMTLPVDIGILENAATMLALRIETAVQRLRLTISGVRFTADADVAPTRTYTHGITVAAGFGAVAFLGATAGDAKLISSSINISCEVVPGFDGDGVYFQHEVHGGKIEVTESWMGKPTTNAGAGYDVTSAKPDRANTAFYKWDVTAVKGMASAAA